MKVTFNTNFNEEFPSFLNIIAVIRLFFFEVEKCFNMLIFHQPETGLLNTSSVLTIRCQC